MHPKHFFFSKKNLLQWAILIDLSPKTFSTQHPPPPPKKKKFFTFFLQNKKKKYLIIFFFSFNIFQFLKKK